MAGTPFHGRKKFNFSGGKGCFADVRLLPLPAIALHTQNGILFCKVVRNGDSTLFAKKHTTLGVRLLKPLGKYRGKVPQVGVVVAKGRPEKTILWGWALVAAQPESRAR